MKRNKQNKKDIFFDFIGLNYLNKIKNYVFFSFLLLIVSSIIGYLLPKLFEEQILKMIKDLVLQTQNLGPFEIISYIIINNTRTAMIGMVAGLFFAVIPIFVILVNGYLLGFVSQMVTQKESVISLWRLLPHGIFEIPAILICIGLGIKLGTFFLSIKDKSKGLIAYLVAFIIFFFSFNFLFVLVTFALGLKGESDIKNFLDSMNSNFTLAFLMIVLAAIVFILSLSVGFLILDKKSRKEAIGNLFKMVYNSIKIFIFIIIPLLLVAGVIEGVLIKQDYWQSILGFNPLFIVIVIIFLYITSIFFIVARMIKNN